MSNPTRICLVAGVLFFSACALGLPKEMPPVEGRVVDEETNQPIENAIVIVRWQGSAGGGLVESHTKCYHVETAVSGADGKFTTESWLEESVNRGLALKKRMVDVYKAGYRHARSGEGVQYLERDDIRVEERLNYLQRMVGNMACGSEENQRDELLNLYESLYQEGLNISDGSQGAKKTLNSIRYSLDVLRLGWDEVQKRRATGAYSQ